MTFMSEISMGTFFDLQEIVAPCLDEGLPFNAV